MVNIPTGLFVNTSVASDRTLATDARRALSSLLTVDTGGAPKQGILPGLSDQLLVQSASSSALTFSVTRGYACLVRSASPLIGGYLVGTTTAVSLTLGAANASNPRIDVVYIVQPDPEAGDSTHARIDVQQGTAAASPAAPTSASLPQGALILAQILVPAGATAASACTITDKRVYTAINNGLPVYVGDQTLLPANPPAGAEALVTAPTGSAYGATVYNVIYKVISGQWRPWDSDWQTFTAGQGGASNLPSGSIVAVSRLRAGIVEVEYVASIQNTSSDQVAVGGLPFTKASGRGAVPQGRCLLYRGSDNTRYMLLLDFAGNNSINLRYLSGNQEVPTVGNGGPVNFGGCTLYLTFSYSPW